MRFIFYSCLRPIYKGYKHFWPSDARPDATPDRQAFALLKAQAALIGQHLLKTPGGYALSRWGMVHHCTTVDEVQATLKRMGAKP